MNPPTITVFAELPEQQCGSAPLRFQVLHSNDSEMKDSFLIGEIDIIKYSEEYLSKSASNINQSIFSFTFSNPQIVIPHYFRVAVVNNMGLGPLSEISDVGILGKKSVIFIDTQNLISKPHKIYSQKDLKNLKLKN